mmetsp:Transcript_20251/g.71586  ORF Transcript_20251/g.71586 Transcript_20251/m.71586 type:complete len:605 (-) Transcript_20251:204-2018(-)
MEESRRDPPASGHQLSASLAMGGGSVGGRSRNGSFGAAAAGGGGGGSSTIAVDDVDVGDGGRSVASFSTPRFTWHDVPMPMSAERGPAPLLSLAMLTPTHVDGGAADGDGARYDDVAGADSGATGVRVRGSDAALGGASTASRARDGDGGGSIMMAADGSGLRNRSRGGAGAAAAAEGSASRSHGGALLAGVDRAGGGARFTLVGTNAASGDGGGARASLRQFMSVEEAVTAAKEARRLAARGEALPVWLDCEGTTEMEMEVLARAFSLHPVTVKDCLVEDVSISDEKAEAFPEYLFVIVDALVDVDPAAAAAAAAAASVASDDAHDEAAKLRWQTSNLNLMVLEGFVLTSHEPPLPRLQTMASTLTTHLNAGANVGADWVLFAAFESMVDLLVPRVTSTGATVDELDETILEELTEGALITDRSAKGALKHMPREAKLLRRIGTARRHLGQLHRSLLSKRGILTKLCGSGAAGRAVMPLPGVSPSVQIYLGSVLDRVVWQLERVEASRDTLHTLYSNYLTGMNVRVAQASVMTAQVMKSLTLLLTVTTPLTLVASVFGMNVYPLTIVQVSDGHDNAGLFTFLVAVMVASVVLMVWLAKRRGWL